MDVEEAINFVRSNSRAVLSTMRRDGTPQMSPVSIGVNSASMIVLSSKEASAKARNLRRDPRAWLTVVTERWYGPWVRLAGPVEIVSLPEALPLLEDYYRSVSGEHPDWADYRAVMIRDEHCLIRITPVEVGPQRTF